MTSRDEPNNQLEKSIRQDFSDVNQNDLNAFTVNKEDAHAASGTELEKTVANIWQELIHLDHSETSYNNIKSNELTQVPLMKNETISSSNLFESNNFSDISTTTNFYSLGGHSLQLVQIYQHYQSLFNFDTEVLTIRPFFECNTIEEHAKLLETIVKDDIKSKQWPTLHTDNGNYF